MLQHNFTVIAIVLWPMHVNVHHIFKKTTDLILVFVILLSHISIEMLEYVNRMYFHDRCCVFQIFTLKTSLKEAEESCVAAKTEVQTQTTLLEEMSRELGRLTLAQNKSVEEVCVHLCVYPLTLSLSPSS